MPRTNGKLNGTTTNGTNGRVKMLAGGGVAKNMKGQPGFVHYRVNAKDKQEVRRQVLLGQTQQAIADSLGLSLQALDRHYRDTIRYYQQRMLGKVAGKAYAKALKGETQMVQFVLRTRAGWKERLLGEEDTALLKRVIGVAEEDV